MEIRPGDLFIATEDSHSLSKGMMLLVLSHEGKTFNESLVWEVGLMIGPYHGIGIHPTGYTEAALLEKFEYINNIYVLTPEEVT